MRREVVRVKQNKMKNKTISGNWKTQAGYYLMFIAPVLIIFIFHYLPMAGVYMAFTDYKPAKGIWGSEYVGLKNFIRFFNSKDFVNVLRNTLLYNIGRIILVNLSCGVVFALLLYEIKSRVKNKVFQTCMLLPAFLSWTVISAALMIILQPDNGMANGLLELLGMKSINWYLEKGYWPFIIMFCMIYKDAGMSSIYFYSALLSIDTELFDAANLDGAGRLRQIRHISLPAMSSVFCITLIMQMGSVLSGGISPFYELTLNNGALYDTTQTIGLYLYNGLDDGRFSLSAAVGVTRSAVGMLMVLAANMVIKKIDSDSAMF